MAELERRDIYVSHLLSVIADGEHGLNAVPGHIKKIIEEDIWQDRIVRATGERAQFDQFSDFISAPPPKGLGADVDMLKRMCEEDEEALRLLREVVTGEAGDNQHTEVDEVMGPLFDEIEHMSSDQLEEMPPEVLRDYIEDRC
jgi:hypothetical protein